MGTVSDDLSVIEADFANWRPVTGRKVLQLIFEIDIAQTGEVLRRLGTPTPGESKWCAIALLDLKSSEKTSCAQREPVSPGEQQRNTVGVTAGETATKTSKKFAEMPLSQQAALRCNDAEFQRWIGAPTGAAEAADRVREKCMIQSRSELDNVLNHWPRGRWQVLEDAFQSWLVTEKYAEVRK